MPTGYAADALTNDSDSDTWRLRPDFDPMQHRIDITFDEDGADLRPAGPGAVARTAEGALIAAGPVAPANAFALGDGKNPLIWVEPVLMGAQMAGYKVSEPLTPGAIYTQTAVPRDVPTSVPVSLDDVRCFAPGTTISTIHGSRPVEWLQPGDLVITRDHGFQPVRWVGRFRLTRAQMAQDPRLHPVRIAPGTFGPGAPERALLVSRPHRVLITDPMMELTYGVTEALCAADTLAPTVAARMVGDGFTYYHVLFDDHEVIQANGLWSESLFSGKGGERLARSAKAALPEDITHDATARVCLSDWEIALLPGVAALQRRSLGTGAAVRAA